MRLSEAIPLWVTIAIAAAGFLFVRSRGGGGALAELEQDNATLSGKVQTLTASRDVSLAIAPVLEALKLHEDRAAIRSDKTLALLQLMADHLGRDADAAAA